MKLSSSLKLATLLATTVFFAPVSPAIAQSEPSTESKGDLAIIQDNRDAKESDLEKANALGQRKSRPASARFKQKDPADMTEEEIEQLRLENKAAEARIDAENSAARQREEIKERARLAKEAEDRARHASQEAEYRARRLKDHPVPPGMPNRIDVVVNPDGSVEHIYTGYKITVYAAGQQASSAQADQTTLEENPQRSISTPTTSKAATDGTTETKPRSASAQKRDHSKTSRKSARTGKLVRYAELEPASYQQQRVALSAVSIGLGVGIGGLSRGYRGGMHGGGMHAGRMHGGGHAMGRMR